ncbi:MAG: CHASE domain-containing protein, partial [Steroidobacter sp.]
LLNLLNVAASADAPLAPEQVLGCALIGIGSALQALLGRALIARFIGLPLRLDHLRQMLMLVAIAGPIACLTAASVGVGALWLTGVLSASQMAGNWFVWWLGDVIGVIVFLPLVLIWPGAKDRIIWRGTVVRSLPLMAMAVLIVPLGLTFYAWKIAGEVAQRQAEANFASLADEHEKALLHRLDSYQNALLGGAGFFHGSVAVSREEWRRYVEALQVHTNFPGVNGIGWIEAVAPTALPDFLRQVRADNAPQFQLLPNAGVTPYFIITYIEPVENNGAAVGLNIAFEPHRLEAAGLARDTGKPAITKRIVLVQDQQKTPGFLLLYPIYRDGMPTATVTDRRAALRGWIYAPFIANNLFNDLSADQNLRHTLKIYDGSEERAEALIYSDALERSAPPAFTLRKQLQVMQQQWLVVWESAPPFERREQTNAPLYILIGGLLFTTLFALFLVAVTLHRTDTIEWMAGEGKYALSIGVFLLIALGSYTAFRSLQQAELAHVRERIRDEVTKVGLLLSSQVEDRLFALKRMGQRWEAAGGTSQALWQADAHNYIKQLGGLRAMQWVDASHHIRWVEPLSGNERVVGLDVLRDSKGAGAINEATSKEGATVTPPFELTQGYSAFLAVQPLFVRERFDGYLVGLFAVEDFFRSAMSAETSGSYALAVEYEGHTYFSNEVPPNLQESQWGIEHRFLLNDKQWMLRLVPTREFIATQRSALPVAVLIAGMLIAVLSAISLRYILVSRLKSARLAESSSLNAAILASTPFLVIATDQQGKIITINRTAERALGYDAHEVIGRQTPALWHDPDEIVARAKALSEELHEPLPPGFGVLVRQSVRDGIDSREWTYIRKDGSRFPGNFTVTALRDHRGVTTGYLGVVEDVTERRRQQQALRTSEETFRTAMQFAPIGQVLIAPDGRWLKVNPALGRLLGYSEEDLLAGRMRWLTEGDSEADVQTVRKLQSGQAEACQLEKVFQRHDGRVISMLLSISLVRRADGQPDYLIAQVQDVTASKEMERIKNEFISVVSHELRTPLTSIRGSLGLLLGVFMKELPQKVKSLIEIAYNNCERLIPLINDILDIDKIASGHMRFEMQEESVAALTLQAVQANEAYARKFDVSIVVAPIDESLRVMVDAARYQQVLSNLLSNAAKFSPPGGVIEVSAEARDSRVSISVRDYGEGISDEFQSRIFSKFSQADSSATRAKGGTGLGLHIAKQLVEQMNGAIGYSTQVGTGTTFRIEFPQCAQLQASGSAATTFSDSGHLRSN